ncbi:MAG: phage portal protein [Treponema sp.]|nr:phage portal protein [Treponema sp.]
MKLLDWLRPNSQRQKSSSQRADKALLEKSQTMLNFLSADEDFNIFDKSNTIGDTYLLHAWVNIAVNILIRNIARADFTVKREGNDIECGAIYDLFRRPNPALSRFDLWKETAAQL